MKKTILIILLFIITNCSLNKVSYNHGIKLLEKRSEKIIVGESNSNDVMKILGPPSFKSEFDNKLWFYIEQKKTTRTIFKFGAKKTIKNNVLYIALNQRGVIIEKKLYNLEDMENIEFDKSNTNKQYEKDTYLYNVLTSLREKINAPTRNKKKTSN